MLTGVRARPSLRIEKRLDGNHCGVVRRQIPDRREQRRLPSI